MCRVMQRLRMLPRINPESLAKKGLDHEAIARIEAALPGAFELEAAFAPEILGEKCMKKIPGLRAALCRKRSRLHTHASWLYT